MGLRRWLGEMEDRVYGPDLTGEGKEARGGEAAGNTVPNVVATVFRAETNPHYQGMKRRWLWRRKACDVDDLRDALKENRLQRHAPLKVHTPTGVWDVESIENTGASIELHVK